MFKTDGALGRRVPNAAGPIGGVGLSDRLLRSAASLLGRLGGPWWERLLKTGGWLRPRLVDLRDRGELNTADPARLLEQIVRIDASAVRRYLDEAWTVAERLTARSHDLVLKFPQEWAASPATGALLYTMVRSHAPELVVETGVANGVSSSFILEGLVRNGKGRLVSFDTSPEAGGLIASGLREKWRLEILPPAAPRPRLREVLGSLPEIDLAFLDADHSYTGQNWEYSNAWTRLQPGGYLVSDDVDWSFAFLDFCHRQGRTPAFLVAESKVVGLVRSPP